MANRALDRLLPVLMVLAAAAGGDLLGGAHGHAGRPRSGDAVHDLQTGMAQSAE